MFASEASGARGAFAVSGREARLCYLAALLQALYHSDAMLGAVRSHAAGCAKDRCAACLLKQTEALSAQPGRPCSLRHWQHFLGSQDFSVAAGDDPVALLETMITLAPELPVVILPSHGDGRPGVCANSVAPAVVAVAVERRVRLERRGLRTTHAWVRASIEASSQRM